MHIVLTNDDSIFAPGLIAAYNQLKNLGKVTVIAPTQAQSGASHAISLDPLTYEKMDITGKFIGFGVEGTPADCIKMACNGLIMPKEKIDLVVSGINLGANAGIHVHYSGTVAAAVEAGFYGIPAISLSAAYEENVDFEKIAACAMPIINKLLPLNSGDVININIPALSAGKPKGVKVLPHSTTGYEELYQPHTDTDGRTTFLYSSGKLRDAEDTETDVAAVIDGYITITALHFDMTDYQRNAALQQIDWNT